MIWLTWRQHRKQLLFTLLTLAALAAVMVPTGLSMHHEFVKSGLSACLGKAGTAQLVAGNAVNCSELSSQFSHQYSSLTFIAVLFVILPVFVGIFYGAPLVAHEIEQGTHRFVWTQGVGRMRWALAKFGLIGLVTLVIALVYAIGVTWWFSPLIASGNNGRMNYVSFDVQGVVPIAYTLFAVALGVFLGVYSRKVLPAMGITLAGFIAVRVVIEWVARKNYLSPVSLKLPITSTQQYNMYAGDWIYSNSVVGAQGKTLLADAQLQCLGGNVVSMSTSAGSGALQANANPCADAAYQGAYNLQSYQPGERFWDFQWIESGVFLALAALLIWFALMRLRRIG
ncbi:ABC transporter permease [Actinospica sp.]|jgi:ABC-type transport system involved in multi-copper enzyme maturation permease subunit|uniref:ABC transporter permease n=1 Tax=Actinospica sp. TaxID=1872142 RepID=UPI002C806299|nr:ABC transporter permease subunit [Actinospica sp.]HWG27770.1 ABC transporter permease subunit [Actinospica sp.]